MIHSMAGGDIKQLSYADYAKVEILDGDLSGKNLWFKSPFFDLKVGDVVLVETDGKVKGKIVRIDKNVSSQIAPQSLKNSRSIIKIVKRA